MGVDEVMLPHCPLQTVAVNARLQGKWQEPPPALATCRHGPEDKNREEMPLLADDGLTPARDRSPWDAQKKRGGDGTTCGMMLLSWWGRGDRHCKRAL